MKTRRKLVNLQFTHRAAPRLDLAVDIGYTYRVGIDQINSAYARTYQGFGAPASYTAYTENYNPYTGKGIQSFGAGNKGKPLKYRINHH
jgi:hypothetical protein